MSTAGPNPKNPNRSKIPFTVDLFSAHIQQYKENNATIKDVAVSLREKFTFTYQDVFSKIPSGEFQNVSLALFGAIALAEEGEEGLFRDIWLKYKNLISPEELSEIVKLSEDEDGPTASIAGFLLKGVAGPGQDMVSELLTQWPDVFSPAELNSKMDGDKTLEIFLLESAVAKNEIYSSLRLITARNKFFKMLHEIQTKDQVHLQLNDLKRLANTAYHLGYINSFYDIGMLLQELELPAEALSFFEHVPADSRCFQLPIQHPCDTAYFLAVTAQLDAHRLYYLKQALTFALKISDSLIRQEYIQKIYNYVIHGGTLELNEPSLIPMPEGVLIAIEKGTKEDLLLKMFEDVKEKLKLQKTSENLAKENKKLKRVIEKLTGNHENQTETAQGKKKLVQVDTLLPTVSPLYAIARKSNLPAAVLPLSLRRYQYASELRNRDERSSSVTVPKKVHKSAKPI